MFTRNVGTADRVIRVLLGLFLMGFAYDHASWWWIIGVWMIGVPIFVTGVFGTCFLYTLLGWSTCPVQQVATSPNPSADKHTSV